MASKFSSLILLSLLLTSITSSSSTYLTFPSPEIGVNFGRLASNLPPPSSIATLVSSLSIKNVKTFDLDPSTIKSFANTNISLSLCIPNSHLFSMASNPRTSDLIVARAILPYIHKTHISSIAVGNEVSMLPEYAPVLVKAMENLYTSLRKYRLHHQVKVSTPHSLAVLAVRFPPSGALFQDSIAETVIRPVLTFLNRTNSPFMVNLYPYLTYKEYPYIPLEYALFTQDTRIFNYTDPKTRLVYANLFDLLVDGMNGAIASLGFGNAVPLMVTETGWPSEGGVDDKEASLENAALFNQKLVEHVTGRPVKGTPLRPGVPVVTFLFSLIDEDLKDGALTEKHWGLFYGNGTKKYDLKI